MSGLSRTPGKRVGAKHPPRVRIPPSPPGHSHASAQERAAACTRESSKSLIDDGFPPAHTANAQQRVDTAQPDAAIGGRTGRRTDRNMGVWAMVRKPKNGTLHVLAPRQIQSARDGDHNDGGGLLLRGRGTAASYVYRYTAASGRRREMGLGLAHRGSLAQAAKVSRSLGARLMKYVGSSQPELIRSTTATRPRGRDGTFSRLLRATASRSPAPRAVRRSPPEVALVVELVPYDLSTNWIGLVPGADRLMTQPAPITANPATSSSTAAGSGTAAAMTTDPPAWRSLRASGRT